MDLPKNEAALLSAVETTRKLLKQLRIRLALARIKEAGLRGPGRPRRALPLNRERVLALRAQGFSERALAKRLTGEVGQFVSRDAVREMLRAGEVLR